MIQAKRKVFSFDEADLEWINPLITEWVKDNEGKKGSDLIVQLLREFKLQRDGALLECESQPESFTSVGEDRQDYLGRVLGALNINRDKIESGARQLQDELQSGYEGIKDNIGKGAQVLGNRLSKMESRMRGFFSRPREEGREGRIEDLEAEVERLQDVMNELMEKLAKKREDDEEAAALEAGMEEILPYAEATTG